MKPIEQVSNKYVFLWTKFLVALFYYGYLVIASINDWEPHVIVRELLSHSQTFQTWSARSVLFVKSEILIFGNFK